MLKIFKNKKTQFKIQEMAFVLLAVVLLFGLVFVFFARFELEKVRNIAETTREERAVTLVRVIASMPELRCSGSINKISEAACLDLDKVKAFNNSDVLRSNYRKIWQSSFVTEVIVREIFPGNKTYTIYKEQESNESYYSFMPLCSQKKCVVARLIVGIKTV
ncbi:MAG: hypothetical protein QXP53_00950 [Candidatus Pacearchaeota archaeon]